MVFASLFEVCCGGEEEGRKLSAVTAALSDADEEEWKRVQSQRDAKQHIRHVEHQISKLNRKKNRCRDTITAKPLCTEMTCTFRPPEFEKSEEDMQSLIDYLNHSFIFDDHDDNEKSQIALAMQMEEVDDGTILFRQGDEGDYCYVSQSGTAEYFEDDTKVSEYTPGEFFGMAALLYDSKRVATCKVVTEVEGGTAKLWKLDQKSFKYTVAHNIYKRMSSMKDRVRNIEMFKGLDETLLNRFIHNLAPIAWTSGERIVEKGEEGTVFYIITSGQVRIHDIGLGDSQYDDQILGPGQAFGERALLTGEPRAANVTAITDVGTMAIDRSSFEEYIGPLQGLLERNMRKKFLKALPLIRDSQLTEEEIDQLAGMMTELCYRKGHFLAESGKPYSMNLWIIQRGTLLVYSSKRPENIYNLQNGDYFGDKSISGDPDRIGSHTAVCEENLTTWVLTRKDIELVIGDISRLGSSKAFAKTKQDRSIMLSHLKRHRVLGQGGFGKVWLVSHKSSTESYALKVISKQKLVRSHQVQSVLREKDMLCLLQHPFILHLVSTFQDEDNLYLLLPVIQGGELYSQVRSRSVDGRGLPSYDAAFYAACIVEALGHFHQRHIAYRDLKLENVLLDNEGYCIIVDLGFAKVVTDKTFTMVGTPEYLAPEVIMSRGHNHAADYWSFGVLVYELMCGLSPFFQKGSSQMDMFKRIVMVKYDMPEFLDEHQKSFVMQLLVRKQANRLGNQANGYVDIKRHEWFQAVNLDFRRIHKKELKAPWKPKLTEDPLDVSDNFDDFSSLRDESIRYGNLSESDQKLFESF